ncbi:hypothetical protein GCM10010172_22380 [Paractinoplanes ferrugineus]|uniref:Uncharacterized protein n=2 Tax=Paractinoplanes ferrugineus TaxID=113564 RepID=A0A919M6Y7_9ACTN|nr:hypothetical protein Afe05nite_06910 [Actinoplanes ferrugineus]
METVAGTSYFCRMLLESFRALLALLDPTRSGLTLLWSALLGPALAWPALSGPALSGPALSGPALSGAQLVVGLALIAAVLLVAAATIPVLAPPFAPATYALAHRARATLRPRLADPDAPGRPRSRAPAVRPAAA